MVADFGVDVYFAVHKGGSLHWAVSRNNAFFAAAAFFLVRCENTLTDYAEVVKVGFYAVVRASTHRYFELMGQGNVAEAYKKSFVNFLAQGVGVDKSVLAGCTLAGNNGAYLCARTACSEASFL